MIETMVLVLGGVCFKKFLDPLADPLTDIVFQPTAQAGTACTKTNQWWVDWLEGIEKK